MTKEIQVIEPRNIQASPIEMAQAFLTSGGDLANLEKMLALQEKYDSMQAKKAFIKAMAKFKQIPVIIKKDKDNKQYNSKYSSIGAMVNACLPRMGECGLSHKWEFFQVDPKFMEGKCTVTHEDGFSDSVSMTAPIDISGNKNPIQQIKSTRTYIKIETFSSVMGLASSEDIDDDGNSAGGAINEKEPAKTITIGPENINWLMGFCKRNGITTKKDKKEFQEHYKFSPHGTTTEEFEAIKESIKKNYNEVDE